MNSFQLVNDIKEHLSNSLSNHLLRVPGDIEQYKPPKLFIGQLPARTGTRPNQKSNEETDFPFVLIRATSIDYEGASEKLESITDVSIICGIYSAELNREISGVEDLMNLMDKIVLDLSAKRYWLNNKFVRGESIKCIIGMPKEFGPYDAGLQEAGANFGGVIQLSFNREFIVEQDLFIKGTY